VSLVIPPRQRNPPSGYRHGPSARAGVSAAIVSPTAAAVKLGGCLDSAVRRSPTLATEGRSRGGRFEAGGNRAAVPRFFQALTEEEEVVQLMLLQEAGHFAARAGDDAEPPFAALQH